MSFNLSVQSTSFSLKNVREGLAAKSEASYQEKQLAEQEFKDELRKASHKNKIPIKKLEHLIATDDEKRKMRILERMARRLNSETFILN